VNTKEEYIIESKEKTFSATAGIWTIGLSSLIYALVRYVTFSPKYAEHIPSFIVNKAVGMAAAFLLVGALLYKCRGDIEKSGAYFRAASFAVFVHIPLSLGLLRPGYFPDFFSKEGSTLNFWAEMVMLCGALGVALFWQNSRDRSSHDASKLGIALLAVIFCHVGAMGICRGLNINAKHAYLPPMWMLSLIGIGVGIVGLIRYYMRHQKSSDSVSL